MALGAVVWLTSAHEVRATSGWPSEQAQVIAIRDHHGLFSPCGKGGGQEKDVTWRSLAPPLGLPTIFVERNTCLDTSLGERRTVVRVVDGRLTKIFVDPTRSYGEAAVGASLAAGLAFAIMLAILLVRRWWRRRRPANGGHP